jgi:Fic family protein
MRFNAEKPYNDLPLLPPKEDIESKEILKKCISARTAIAELKQAGQLIPNQSVLINSIPMLEAQMSSEIENIVTTTDKLFQFASGEDDKADVPTKETLRYRQALAQGYQSIKRKPVCTRIAVEICGAIRDADVDVRKLPGTALKNPQTGKVVYTPPEGERLIREKLSNWEKFLNERTDIDPLIRMAVMHYQFEAIHPFTDGNGRTGRLLNILFLIQEGLLEIPVLYLSRYIIDHKNEYYACLREVTEKNQWQAWILYMLDAVQQTAGWTTQKIRAIRSLLEHTCNYVRNTVPRIYSRELVDITFTQPYCRIANVVDAGIARRQTASAYLKQLVNIGILKETNAGKERLFVHPKYFNLLTQDGNTFKEYPMEKNA